MLYAASSVNVGENGDLFTFHLFLWLTPSFSVSEPWYYHDYLHLVFFFATTTAKLPAAANNIFQFINFTLIITASLMYMYTNMTYMIYIYTYKCICIFFITLLFFLLLLLLLPRFSMESRLNHFKTKFNITLPGSIHADELCYLFRYVYLLLYTRIFKLELNAIFVDVYEILLGEQMEKSNIIHINIAYSSSSRAVGIVSMRHSWHFNGELFA